jgi:hypothetical protein
VIVSPTSSTETRSNIARSRRGAERRTVEQRLDVHVAYLAVGENHPVVEGSSGIAAFTPGAITARR